MALLSFVRIAKITVSFPIKFTKNNDLVGNGSGNVRKGFSVFYESSYSL
jgi:hypothetical protein